MIVCFAHLSVRLFVHQFTFPSVCLSFCLSVYPSLHPSLRLSIFLSVCMYVCPSSCLFCMPACLPTCMSVCPYVCLYVCKSVSLYACLSIRLFVCPSVRPSVKENLTHWYFRFNLPKICLWTATPLPMKKKRPVWWRALASLQVPKIKVPKAANLMALIFGHFRPKYQKIKIPNKTSQNNNTQ